MSEGIVVLEALGRACRQGGLAFFLVWALCRLLPRLPGRTQCWLWRLAYLKLLVALLWATPLELPLLPPQSSAWQATGDSLQTTGDSFQTTGDSPKGLRPCRPSSESCRLPRLSPVACRLSPVAWPAVLMAARRGLVQSARLGGLAPHAAAALPGIGGAG